jgi:hypothetical protein
MATDEFGGDPSVQMMRRLFAAVEVAQQSLLNVLGISPFDSRLRQWRKMALHLFEQNWAAAARHSSRLTEKDAGDLYAHCLARAVETRGVVVPKGSLPANDLIMRLLEEKK